MCYSGSHSGSEQGFGKDTFEEVTRPAHEGVAKVVKVGTVTHFFCENIGNIASSINVGDQDSAIGNPFVGGVLPILNVTIAFCRHVVTPLDAGVVVIIERGRRLAITNGVAEVQ